MKFRNSLYIILVDRKFFNKGIKRLNRLPQRNITELKENEDTSEKDAQGSNKRYKIDARTPIFSGRNVESWLFVANNALDNARVRKADKLSVITTYLKGTPLYNC